ncbi:MAG: methyltransferase domain-containing protein [Phycisphaerales bacterium]|nr:methyltransferase domain-containing protein [Phycisphaerales bacterium]
MLARRLQAELMDDPAIDAGEHRRALAGLARINALSRAGASVWSGVHDLLRGHGQATLLDVAVGSGDVLVDVVRRAGRAGVELAPQACDISAEALTATAERAAATGVRVVCHRSDVVRGGIPLADGGVDVVMCSLFLHHLEERNVVGLLREMARVARVGVIVSDLVRCWRGVVAAGVAGRVLTRSPVVRVDAVRSVQGAFTVDEVRAMAAAAGMSGARVAPSWPMRMLLTWRRT